MTRRRTTIPVILVTGKNGQVGWELQRTLFCLGKIVAVDHYEIDFSNQDSIRDVIRQIKPDVIVNAAAYTAVDKAEEEAEIAMQVNGVAPGIIAEEAKRLGALLIHYSTDYVFNGEKDSAYIESDVTDPINTYGRTKLAGEQAIQSVDAEYLILRTSWVYSARSNNFLHTILRLAQEKEELCVVNDQIGSPTWARLIAEVTSLVINQQLNDKKDGKFISGLFHLVSAGSISWYGFASEIVKFVKNHQSGSYKVRNVKPITTQDHPTLALRPNNSLLCTDRLSEHYGITLPDWKQSLRLCMEELR